MTIERRRNWARRLRRELPKAHGRACYGAALEIDRLTSIRLLLGLGLAHRLVQSVGDLLRDFDPGLATSRISSDVFGILLLADSPAAATAMLERLRVRLEQRFDVGGHRIPVRPIIGYAGPVGDDGVGLLAEQAQIALDQARRGQKRLSAFDPSEYGDPLDRLSLMADLRRAIAEDQLDMAYQPKTRARDGGLAAAEALVRWRHPDRGFVSPEDFVRVAEETGDIRELTDWGIDRVLRDGAYLAERGFSIPLAINISARLLSDGDYTTRLLTRLAGRGDRISIEITETSMLDDPAAALANLVALRDAGIGLAIDDYGAGMSSLTYLKQLPARELKIDKRFIQRLGDSHSDPMIVRSTIDLAHGLGLEVTAEGVETASAAALLKIMGCDLLQGYLIARPMSVDALIAFAQAPRETLLAMPGFTGGDAAWHAA